MSCFTKPNDNTLEALILKKDELAQSIDVTRIYDGCKRCIDDIIERRDYNGLLKIYNRKSLHNRVSHFFNLGRNEYPNLVLRLLKTPHRNHIVNALLPYMPNIN